ncbi:MAG: hypothetical protein JXB19_11060 [Bacteroidales bacterium]|nr:hypothetical protein [Bacteroidales bacterium]
MTTSVIKKIAGFMMIATGLTLGLYGQVRNDAIRAFNAGVGLMKTDIPAAIESFENCVAISEQVGDSAEDIRLRAVNVLPGLYFQIAYNLLDEENKLQESIQASHKALEVAEKYDNASVKENTEKILIQAYSTMASGFFSSKENEKAIQAFDSVLMINPDHINSLYNKALIYRGIGDIYNFEESIDVYIQKLKDAGDSARVEQANNIAIDYLRVEAVKANQANELDRSLELLNDAMKYGPHKEVYYQFANIYNKQKKFSEAVESAQLGLELETGSAEDKAKFYFELAEAQANLGQTSSACASYRNAAYGAFVEASKAQLQNLKCP